MPNREYEIKARTPSQVSLKNLSDCTGIVRTKGAVDPVAAALELPRAEILALASTGNLIVGVGAIKRRRAQNTRARSQKAVGWSFDSNTSELGYIVVDPEHRGQRLVGTHRRRIAGQACRRAFCYHVIRAHEEDVGTSRF
jgi:hypothetical protein